MTTATISEQHAKLKELMERREPLCDELARRLEKRGDWTVLHHPLIVSVPYAEEMNAAYNDGLRQKKAALNKAVADGNWSHVMMLHERAWRLNALIEYAPLMSDEAFWEEVAYVWCDTETPYVNKSVWVRLFKVKRPGRHGMMDEDEQEMLARMPREITVYRGHDGRSQNGLSWTLCPSKARWFAGRFINLDRRRPIVTKGVVGRDKVIALFLRRDEFEIVCEARHVRDKTEVDDAVAIHSSVSKLYQYAVRRFRLNKLRTDHGPRHWSQVMRNVERIHAARPDTNLAIGRAFAVLHDCCREDEYGDPEHGERAAKWIVQMVLEEPQFSKALDAIGMTNDLFDKLLTAIAGHNRGEVSTDATIGMCWDADRMDLPRVGIVPDAKLFSLPETKGLLWR